LSPKPETLQAYEANKGMESADVGSKRSLQFVRDWLTQQGFDAAAIWLEIEKVIVIRNTHSPRITIGP